MHCDIAAAVSLAFSLLGAEPRWRRRSISGRCRTAAIPAVRRHGKRYEFFGGMSYVGAIRRADGQRAGQTTRPARSS